MHTPAPWWVAKSRIVGQSDPPNGPHAAICSIKDTSTADARLIAAAPDLLAACKAIYTTLQDPGATAEGVLAIHGERLRAAIAKAETGQPDTREG